MAPLWLVLAFAHPAPALPPPGPVRLVDERDLHVGVRPAAVLRPDEVGAGVTVQVTASFLTF